MKAIAYNIKNQEKELLVKANSKKHELTFISNELNQCTIIYSFNKEAVILYSINSLDPDLLGRLKELGVKQIISRTDKPNNNLIQLARKHGIYINYIHNSLSDERKAHLIIKQLDRFANSSLIKTQQFL